jgi:hypothetical protein
VCVVSDAGNSCVDKLSEVYVCAGDDASLKCSIFLLCCADYAMVAMQTGDGPRGEGKNDQCAHAMSGRGEMSR